MEIVDNLVANIQTDWAAQGFRATAFPEVAAGVLTRAQLSEEAARSQLFRYLMESEPPVKSHPAGNLATLYTGSRFSIHLHMWKDGEAGMHHHAWGGAYQILAGSSIDGTYSFRPADSLRQGLVVGDFAQRDIRRMQPGDFRIIEPGSSFIHGFSYLSKIGLTISVRTRELYQGTTMEYFRPALGVRLQNTGGAPEFITERTRVLEFLKDADPRQHRECLVRMAGHADPFVSFEALRHAQTTQVDDDHLDAMREVGGRTHGPIFDILFDSTRDIRSMRYLHERREDEPEDQMPLRMLSSLLHVCLDRDALLGATSGIVEPDDPVQWITANSIRLLERASGIGAGGLARGRR